MNSYTYLFKTIIIGDPSVGKSCLLKQFLEHRFKVNTETTIGVQFGSKILQAGHHKIKMQIWDTAGQEVFKSITRSYYRGSVAAILMYDITSRQSFKDMAKWLQQTRNYANQKISLLLVGNKCDLQQKREVSTQEGSTFAESNKMIFMECSAKDHQLTQQAFLKLANEVLRKIERHQIDPKNQQHGIKLGNMGRPNKKQPIRLCCFW